MNANSLLASPTGLSPYLRFGCLSCRLFYFKLTDLYRKVSMLSYLYVTVLQMILLMSNPSHEHLTLTWNTQHYFTTILQLFIHHTYIYNIFFFSISNLHVRPVHTWLSVLHSVFAIVYIAYLYICILFFCCLCPVPLLSFCCTVELCHYNKFLVCVNIPGQ